MDYLSSFFFFFGDSLFVYLGQNSMTQHEEHGGRLMCAMLLRKNVLWVKQINSEIKYCGH